MFNPYFETPFERLLRLAKEEEERKKREQQAKFAALAGLALLGGLAASNSRGTLLGGLLDTKRVFVSFDYDNDKNYKYLLEAWHSNPKFQFVFRDATPGEIESNSIAVIKRALIDRIKSATHTLVIVGKYANSLHKDYREIGFRNWINFEVNQSKLYRNKIVAVKIDKNYTSPDELLCAGASWAMSFTEAAIMKALEQV